MITIVIPCFNEGQRLDSDSFLSFIKQNSTSQLLFVDDGSADNTADTISSIQNQADGRIVLLSLPKNSGKAEAVRQGVLQALRTPCRYIGYWDADLATPLTAIPEFLELFKTRPEKKIICGSRVQRMGASIKRHWYRHYPGRVIATCISMILGLPFYDSQCGAKLIERELAEKVFLEPFLSRWLFDVEIIARIIGLIGNREAQKIIFELPLSKWSDIADSKISLSYLPRIPFELSRIYFHYRRQLGR